MKFLIALLTSAALAGPLTAAANEPQPPQPPAVMLAHKYQPHTAVAEYYVSEKLDGVRARWTGSQLISRGGKTFAAPGWFTAGFPPTLLDGELWSGRGEYQKIASITARKAPHEGWQQLRFMLFDLPAHGGPFVDRVQAMQKLPKAAFLGVVKQQQFADETQLLRHMERILADNGEGLMLHHAKALYRSGRSHDLLKLKHFDDADATVVGYRPGKGEYLGLVGALQVQTDGKTFYLGSGLSDEDRHHPPAIGSRVTYRYQGFTDSGLPRFAVYLRQRSELGETHPE